MANRQHKIKSAPYLLFILVSLFFHYCNHCFSFTLRFQGKYDPGYRLASTVQSLSATGITFDFQTHLLLIVLHLHREIITLEGQSAGFWQ